MSGEHLPAAAGVHQVLGMQHRNRLGPDSGMGLVVEITVPPGLGAPPHRHEQDAEAFFMLDGSLTVELEGVRRILQRGDTCHLPTGSVHAFRNEGAAEARFLALITPGHDAFAFFDAVHRAAERGPLDPAAVMDLGRAHGLGFGA